jgi:hypothetical protein
MLRRTAALLVPALLLAAAACGGQQDDASGQLDTERPTVDLSGAVATAQSSMPIELPDSRVRVLLEDLCAAGVGDAGDVANQVAAMPLADAGQADAVVQALDAGTDELCPEEVDPAVHDAVAAAAVAAAPTTTTVPTPSAAGAPSQSRSGASPSTNEYSDSSTAGSSSSGGSSNSSSGSGAVGSGNADGSGNQSSTNFGQSVSGTTG